MLAQTAADVDEAFGYWKGEVAFEWKMDGARIQVHKVGTDVRIYTRSLNEVTEAVPEIVETVRALPVRRWCSMGRRLRSMRRGGRIPSR